MACFRLLHDDDDDDVNIVHIPIYNHRLRLKPKHYEIYNLPFVCLHCLSPRTPVDGADFDIFSDNQNRIVYNYPPILRFT